MAAPPNIAAGNRETTMAGPYSGVYIHTFRATFLSPITTSDATPKVVAIVRVSLGLTLFTHSIGKLLVWVLYYWETLDSLAV